MYIRNGTLSIYLKSYPITSILIILQVILMSIMWLPFMPGKLIYSQLIGINLNISEGEVWRILTPIFIHNSFSHFFYNTLSIAVMGPMIEHLIGKWKFTLLYIGSGLTANVVTYISLPLSYTHVGASGAIFGLLGCFILFVVQKKFFIPKQNLVVLLLIIAVSTMMAFFQSDVNITSHISGLFAGLLISWIILPRNL
jgi:rhomboid protease GluP